MMARPSVSALTEWRTLLGTMATKPARAPRWWRRRWPSAGRVCITGSSYKGAAVPRQNQERI